MMPRLIVVVIAVDAVLLAAAPVHAQELDEITLEDIWAAFRARQEQVQTAKVTWNYRLMMSADSARDTLANEPEGRDHAADIAFEDTCRLSLSGDRVRYESPIAVFAYGQGGAPTRSISTFDGVEQQSFTASLNPDRPHSGSLRESDAANEWSMIPALTYALRPLRPELFGPEPGDWRILDGASVIDGVECVVLELRHPVEPGASPTHVRADRAYLDPEHGFRLLRRNNVMSTGQIGFQVDARYEEGDAPDWFPTSWNWAMYGFVTGKLRESSENRLVSVVLNEPIPDSEFRIEFPPGTEVTKSTTPYDWQMYVAGADGELVPASPRRHVTMPAPEPWWRSWGLIAAGVLLLALAIAWGIRRKLRISMLVLAGVLAVAAPGLAQDRDQITLDDIWAAFRARQEQVQTAQVTWKYRFVMSEYMASGKLANERENSEEPSDIVFPEQTCRLVVAGERVRYESPIAAFAHGLEGRPTRSISAFDGAEQQSYSESLRPDTPHSGSLRETDAFNEWDMVHLHALNYALRPLRPELFGTESGAWRILDEPAVISGHQCVVLEQQHPVDPERSPPRHRALRVYLDPEHAFRLLRSKSVINSQVTIQVDARYEGDDTPEWLPTNWDVATYGAVTGRLRESSEGRLVSVVLNEPIPDNEFRIKFPPGTRVRRIFTPYESQMYVAGADGELVPASPREHLNVTPAAQSWWRSWGMIGCGIALLAMLVVWGTWWGHKHV